LSDQLPTRTYASSGGVVVDPAGERLLVLLRPGREGPGGHPEIRLPKGHVEPGESRHQAALREVEEETGVQGLSIVTDLGHQIVAFDWQEHHYVRDESCFLMTSAQKVQPGLAEAQFKRLWLTWPQALERLTFEAEREWVRRAHAAWLDAEQAAD
jgi:8-oxo-dGTP pyrophosphatase MutT (NUDIX family)